MSTTDEHQHERTNEGTELSLQASNTGQDGEEPNEYPPQELTAEYNNPQELNAESNGRQELGVEQAVRRELPA